MNSCWHTCSASGLPLLLQKWLKAAGPTLLHLRLMGLAGRSTEAAATAGVEAPAESAGDSAPGVAGIAIAGVAND